MKKLFSLMTVILFAMGLTACTSDLDQQIAELEEEKEALQTDLTQTEGELARAHDDINELTDLYEALENARMDVQINVTTIDVDGNETTKYIGFSDDSIPSLAGVITVLFDASIMDTEYGSYLVTLNDMEVPYGAYVAILENEEMVMVGLDDLVIDDEDEFTFQVMWWDTTQQAVYESIQLFIENQVDNYLNEDYIDYNVLLACQNLCDIPVSETDITTYLDGLTPTTVQDYFKAIMIANTLSTSTYSDTYVTALNQMVTTGMYGQTGYGLLALDSYDHGLDYSGFLADAVTYYNTSTPYDEGLDAGGIALVALANHSEEQNIALLIEDYAEWIQNDQLASGGIKTRDIVWNDTTYPGTENAASMAQVILGLVANGIDPASEEYTVGTNNLVLRLTQFQLDNGSFDWDITDDITGDPAFSTPQAFLALVTYYHFMNTYGSYTNPYIK